MTKSNTILSVLQIMQEKTFQILTKWMGNQCMTFHVIALYRC